MAVNIAKIVSLLSAFSFFVQIKIFFFFFDTLIDWLIDWLDNKRFTPYQQYFSHVTTVDSLMMMMMMMMMTMMMILIFFSEKSPFGEIVLPWNKIALISNTF